MPRRCPWSVAAVLVLLSSTYPSSQAASSGISLVLAERVYSDGISGMARDSEGFLWVVGNVGDNPVPTTAGALMVTKPGGSDGVLQRIAPDGSVVYATYIGSSGGDRLSGVALDTAGHIYVTGITGSPNFPTTAGAFDRACGADGTCKNASTDTVGTSDGFVMKLAPGGRTIVYSTYLGGRNYDEPRGIAIDASGRAVVIGTTTSADFPVTPDAFQLLSGGAYDAFYARIAADGSHLDYSTYFGGSHTEFAMGVALDAGGDAYIAGWTMSNNMPVKNALKSHFSGGGQGFLARFSAAGERLYSTYIGGSNSDYTYGVALTPAAVYLTGRACSSDFPGAPRPGSGDGCNWSAFVMKLRSDGSEVLRTVLLEGSYYDDAGAAIAVDVDDVAYVSGWLMSPDVPMTHDAAQITNGGGLDAFLAIVPMGPTAASAPTYATYHGGPGEEVGAALVLDGEGGAWIAGGTRFGAYPEVNAKQPASGEGFVAHFAAAGAPAPVSNDVVLYARDAQSIAGNWQLVTDSSAAGGTRIWNPDAGVPKIGSAAAAPGSYFELTFQAEAGVPYHLWLRMKADNDHWANDSVFVQFSDTVDNSGAPQWQIGTTSSTTVSLEDCTGCGERGWGWNDNGYNVPGPLVTFATSGTHTIRIQQREDGISVDQIVLSSRTYISGAPGTAKDDTTVLAPSDGGSSEPTPPPPPPPLPSDPREIVMYVAGERIAGGQTWVVTADETAAGGARLLNPDAGQAKSSSPSASGSDYFDVQFTAEAGVPYHLWVRSQATNDHWMNDSAFVQFSDSVDSGGNPVWRIGSDSATYVSLEDCSGCGEQGWGWNDNAYGGLAAPIYFAKSGLQTIRVLRREDGISIDQIVLSAGRYLNAAPGVAKNDTTIVAK